MPNSASLFHQQPPSFNDGEHKSLWEAIGKVRMDVAVLQNDIHWVKWILWLAIGNLFLTTVSIALKIQG